MYELSPFQQYGKIHNAHFDFKNTTHTIIIYRQSIQAAICMFSSKVYVNLMTCDVEKAFDFSEYMPGPSSNAGRKDLWIDLVNDTTWTYSGQPADWTNFTPTEPDHEAQVATVLLIDSGQWYDMNSFPTDLFAFVCEQDKQ